MASWDVITRPRAHGRTDVGLMERTQSCKLTSVMMTFWPPRQPSSGHITNMSTQCIFKDFTSDCTLGKRLNRVFIHEHPSGCPLRVTSRYVESCVFLSDWTLPLALTHWTPITWHQHRPWYNYGRTRTHSHTHLSKTNEERHYERKQYFGCSYSNHIN